MPMKNSMILLALLALALFACRREEPVATGGVQLKFSQDTVYLDTVFTTVGSSTYNLRVFNPSDEKVIVDDIRLANPGSHYRINVNGNPGRTASNVEILPKDSIHIFIEVTAAVTNVDTAVVYHDQILFSNKGTHQDVDLITLTRDVHFHYPTNFIRVNGGIIPYSIIKCNEVWTDDKPHVIYGYAVVDSACKLTVLQGAEVYFHANSGLWVYQGGTLEVAPGASPGTGDSVIFAGDRLEPFYEDVPGQWGGALGGIFLQGGSLNNVINRAVIKNATTGLRLDSSLTTNLELTNSYILNCSRTGLFGGYGNMKAENLVVANSGLHLFYAFGGSYEFRHCTFANYWKQGSRSTAAVTLSNYLDVPTEDGLSTIRIVRDLNKTYFGNCIVTGNNRNELAVLKDEAGVLNYEFRNALLDLDPDADERSVDVNDPSHFSDVRVNTDPDFINPDRNVYDLDTNSQAVDQGNNIDNIMFTDILGRGRNFNNIPDLGAFERQY